MPGAAGCKTKPTFCNASTTARSAPLRWMSTHGAAAGRQPVLDPSKVVLTPHNAADTDPDEISKYVARQIERFEAGGALENVVDPARGYG